MGWIAFIAAFAVFFMTHVIPVRRPVRNWLVGRIGRCGFAVAYSMLSLAAFGWLIVAAGRAPHVQFWPWAPWQTWVPLVAMLPVCQIVVLAIGRPNPFSFGGSHNDAFDPKRPGIVRWLRRPLLVAIAIWATAHLAPNGNLAHVLLFGGIIVFAIAGQRMVDIRKKREFGSRWDKWNNAMRAGPRATRVTIDPKILGRITAGIVLYAALIALHPLLFGVSPLP